MSKNMAESVLKAALAVKWGLSWLNNKKEIIEDTSEVQENWGVREPNSERNHLQECIYISDLKLHSQAVKAF